MINVEYCGWKRLKGRSVKGQVNLSSYIDSEVWFTIHDQINLPGYIQCIRQIAYHIKNEMKK